MEKHECKYERKVTVPVTIKIVNDDGSVRFERGFNHTMLCRCGDQLPFYTKTCQIFEETDHEWENEKVQRANMINL